ncbi:MAG: hypothetical protein Devi2KO_40590 [Devosia indica]
MFAQISPVRALFRGTAFLLLASALIVGYTALRIRRRAAPEDKESFRTLPSERAATPQGAYHDPRGEEE